MTKETHLDLIARKKDLLQKYEPQLTPFIRNLFSYSDNIVPYLGLKDSDKLGPEDEVFYAVRSKHIFISCSFPDEAHQVAHMVEIPSTRLTLDNWGMPFKSKFFETCSDKGLNAAILRECKVRAIQSHMASDYCFNKHKGIVINQYVEGDIFKRLPYLKFKNETDLRNWYVSIYETVQANWSLDRIEFEWKRRIDMINETFKVQAAA